MENTQNFLNKEARRKIIFFVGLGIIAILLIGAVVYYAAFTTKGANSIIQPLISTYLGAESTNTREITGSFSEALVYKDIEFCDLKWFGQGNSLKIQRLEISLSSLNLEGVSVTIQNGKLSLPNSDVILFYGDYQNGVLDITIYSKNISASDILDSLDEAIAPKDISGAIADLDIEISGPLFEPEIRGSFIIEELTKNDFFLTNCPGEVKLQLKDIQNAPELNGQVLLKSGTLSGAKTAVIKLKESKIIFTGDPKNPMLELRGLAMVEQVKINILLSGVFDNPELNITSMPPMDEDRLLLILATNKTWQSIETAVNNQEFSADIAKDFLDYLFFSESGDKIAKEYGVRDVSVRYNGTTTGAGATKDVTDKASISYSVEQSLQNKKNPTTDHRVGGEYKITENISVGGEKELKQDNKTEQAQDMQKTDDKVMLKFKKDF